MSDRLDSLRFALAPTVGADRAWAARYGQPLVPYLERCLGMPVRVVAESDYAATVTALREGRIDAAMLGEFATLQGQQSAGVEPLVTQLGPDGEISTYQSVIATRIDSGLHDLPSLRGATIGLVDEQSTSGYVMPRAMLREAGLDPDRDVTVRLLGRHLAVVEAVIAGEVVAGATHVNYLKPPTLDRGPDYARLRVLATSRPIPRGPLVVRANLPADVRQRLADALLRVHEADPAVADVLVSSGRRFILAARPSAPTLKSIAALAGVSYATVSRAVNGSGYVAPATAARIAAIVKELGYRPNGNALSLQGQRAPLVGLVVPLRHDRDADGLFEMLRSELGAAGVPLVLCPVDGPLGESPFLDLLLDGRLGALVVTSAHAGDAALADVARTGRAIVAVGIEHGPPGMVVAAPERAARAVLAALGLLVRDRSAETPRTPSHAPVRA